MSALAHTVHELEVVGLLVLYFGLGLSLLALVFGIAWKGSR